MPNLILGNQTKEQVTNYNGDGIEWEGTTLSVIHMEEGRILPTGAYEYVLKDHLGNTRNGFASDALTASKFAWNGKGIRVAMEDAL